MGKQRLFQLTRGVDCTADTRVTRTYIDRDRSMSCSIRDRSVIGFGGDDRQWAAIPIAAHLDLLREVSVAVCSLQVSRRSVSCHGGFLAGPWRGGHIKCFESFRIHVTTPRWNTERLSAAWRRTAAWLCFNAPAVTKPEYVVRTRIHHWTRQSGSSDLGMGDTPAAVGVLIGW